MRLLLTMLVLAACGPKAPPGIGSGSQPLRPPTVPAAAPTPAPTQTPDTPETATEAPMDHAWLTVPRKRIAVDGLDLAVFDSGGGGPAVLLVHGMGSTSAFWQKQLTGGRLEGYRLIAPDLPGWGDSAQPEVDYTPDFYAQTLLGLMDALDLEQVHLVGHSMGGQAALVLALDHPERLRSLTLSAPAGIETFTAQEGTAIKAFWASQDLAARTQEQARASYGFAFARWDDDVERLLQARMALAATPRIVGLVRATRSSVGGMLDQPVLDRLSDLAVPGLYVYGSADLMIPARAVHPEQTPDTVAEIASSTIDGLQVVRLQDAGHTPHHDQPEAFDAALRAFLEAH